MPTFQHPVDPARSWVWTRNRGADIKAVGISYGDADAPIFIEGVSRAKGVVLANGGFRLSLKDFEALCYAFLIHLGTERNQEAGFLVDAALRQNPDLENSRPTPHRRPANRLKGGSTLREVNT